MNDNSIKETRTSVNAKIPYIAYTDINREEFEQNTILHGSIKIDKKRNNLIFKESNISGDEINVNINAATEENAGVMSADDKINLNNSTVIQINWTNRSSLNDELFLKHGVYNIKGERNPEIDDNLPILNRGGGHSFNARLTVLDSSISGDGKDDDKCITQVLSFSNRLGQGEVYIRTGKGSSLYSLTWEKWSTLQRNVNVEQVNNLNNLKDNGIYSGVWTKGSYDAYPLTFVCVVINDYFIGITPRRISQFVYGLSKFDGSVVYQSRVWDDSKDKWGDWEILNQKEISSMIKSSVDNAIKGVIADAPETFDTLKEIADWVDTHEDLYTILKSIAEQNSSKLSEVELLAVDGSNIFISRKDNSVEIDYKTINGGGGFVAIPAATTEKAGVMSAEDKVTLDSIPNEIDKIKDGDTIVGQAREIHSRNGKTITDSFFARTTAGSSTIGDGVATLKSVGGNIVKNLVAGTSISGWTAGANNMNINFNNGILRLIQKNGERTLVHWKSILDNKFRIENHKYYYSCYVKGDVNSEILFGVLNYGLNDLKVGVKAPKINSWQSLSAIITAKPSSNHLGYAIGVIGKNKDLLISKPFVIDLTEMFCAGKEPTKEECDKLFGTMDALPQGLTIANPTEFKSTGFNQFNPDNVLESKAIVDNAIVSGDKKIAVIPCLPCKVGTGENNGYCIHGEFGDDIKVYLTPLNPMEVEGELYMHELTKDATTDTYVPLIKGYMLVEVPTTANLCAHFLWSEDSCERDTYEPYFESKIELPVIPQMSEWGLAGMYINNELVQDVISLENNRYIKRIGKNAEGFFPLEVQEEYPLPKVDNNYISSDYGVEQFDSVVPCNANNLYYMRSLAGETRNFLDRLYDNTDKTDAKEVADYITNAPNLALRALFVAAGAEYNDTDQIIQKTAPWGTEEKWRLEDDGTYTYWEEPAIVNHLPKHYYLNGLGDITEEQMIAIYNAGIIRNNIPAFYANNVNIRTFLPSKTSGQEGYGGVSLKGLMIGATSIEVAVFTIKYSMAEQFGCAFVSGDIGGAFYNCSKLKYIQKMSFGFASATDIFKNCKNLVYIKMNKLKCNLSWAASSMISKGSVLYNIQKATPTTAITITLHPDAYARIANQPDILAALEAQPLVTLVSA